MKQSFLYASVMLLMIPQTFVMATESVTNSAPPFSNTPGSTTDANYWLQQKAIMQQKSSEMRQKKYEELKVKGADVSLLTSTILDATKTDESTFWSVMKQIQQAQETQSRKEYVANLVTKGMDTSSISNDLLDATKTDSTTFWNAMKHLQQAKEIASRKEYLTKLATQGYDISVFTDAIIKDGTAFWETAKKVQSSKSYSRSEKLENKNPPVLRNDAEHLESNNGTSANLVQEISTRRKIVAELQANGIDTSVITEEVLADGNRFWKYVEYLKKAKAASGITLPPKEDDRPPQIGNEMDHSAPMMGQKDKNEWNRESKTMNPYNGTGEVNRQPPAMNRKIGTQSGGTMLARGDMRPALSEKSKKLFLDRLDKIPEEKKVTELNRIKKQIEKQLAGAKGPSNGNNLIARKLEAMLQIVQDEINNLNDASLVESVMNGN